MAYESRILVVNKFDSKGFDKEVKDFFACEEITRFNLCRIDNDILLKVIAFPPTDCYIWEDGKPTAKDRYGDPIREIPLKEAVKIFTYASAVHDYRRYEPCASLLRGFNTSEWGDLVVLYYGY